MGMTFTTLNVCGAERIAIETLLIDTDQIRDKNAPWLTVVPSHDTEDSNLQRLEKIAKKLTKASDAAALLFFYFDDDMFSCTLYQNGKKSASCDSRQESWAKLGKTLGERFGDDTIPKAFRFASKCSSVEEQIKLLEETVGTTFAGGQGAYSCAKRCHPADNQSTRGNVEKTTESVQADRAYDYGLAEGTAISTETI